MHITQHHIHIHQRSSLKHQSRLQPYKITQQFDQTPYIQHKQLSPLLDPHHHHHQHKRKQKHTPWTLIRLRCIDEPRHSKKLYRSCKEKTRRKENVMPQHMQKMALLGQDIPTAQPCARKYVPVLRPEHTPYIQLSPHVHSPTGTFESEPQKTSPSIPTTHGKKHPSCLLSFLPHPSTVKAQSKSLQCERCVSGRAPAPSVLAATHKPLLQKYINDFETNERRVADGSPGRSLGAGGQPHRS